MTGAECNAMHAYPKLWFLLFLGGKGGGGGGGRTDG